MNAVSCCLKSKAGYLASTCGVLFTPIYARPLLLSPIFDEEDLVPWTK